MTGSLKLRAAAVAAALLVAACGGGGGGGTPAAAPPVVTNPAPAAPASVPTAAGSLNVTFGEVAVHDPSVVKAGDLYYVFGSHGAAAKSADLISWTKVADGVNAANPLFNNAPLALKEALSWAQSDTLWAADVIEIGGKFYYYYNACKGDSPVSALGVAVADKIEGPYVDQGVFLKSGMWGQAGADGAIYDALKHPNVVDPDVFFDAAGKLWMVYGSYSGGIFILEMDKTSGKPLAGQGYGKHLIGGNHSRIEGAYIQYSPETQYYYMFTSFGGLDANGAYNVRVARSKNPNGPYVDAKGTDMATVKSNPALPLFDDASIAPHGVKLMGNHVFKAQANETGTPQGYVSPGHNSTHYDAASKKYFMIFHARFPNRGEQHEVRVHEMFMNADGWPVVAPLRYVPLSKNATALAAEVSAMDAQGTYQFINHGKDISAATRQAQSVVLNADGSVSGDVSGTWKHEGANNVSLTLGTTGSFKGVLSRQYNPNLKAFLVTFTVQSADGVSLWGVRTGS